MKPKKEPKVHIITTAKPSKKQQLEQDIKDEAKKLPTVRGAWLS